MTPFSILDLAPITEGSDAAQSFRNTLDLARHGERLGYHRFWLAEHHGMPGIASAATAVLIGHVAGGTSTIRVGAGGIMLPNHSPLVIAEQFGTLESLYPGRIDLGLGRSGQRRIKPHTPRKPPSPEPPREWREVDGVVIPPLFDLRALLGSARVQATLSILQQPEAVAPDFAEQVGDIIAMLTGSYQVDGIDVHAVPGEGAGLTPWIFGSSKGRSAQVAGALGLPFVASYHLTPATALDAIDAYRDAFVATEFLPRPYVVVSADVVVADDTATATHLASSYGHWVYSIRAGGGAVPYPDPDECDPLTDEQLAVVNDRIATQFVGSPDEVAERLAALQRATGADELVVTSVTYRHSDRLRSHELIAQRWGLFP
jgi:alkanesulfonate monooxygenase SsuD/methylene tetrahydromethanopterin reductase-like flavin-dependent oxidoreductase (luciferase family)